jgi:hypothetical protein
MTNGEQNTPQDAEYIDAATAGEILGVSPRQAMRYGAGSDAPVRTSRDGRRVFFHAGDVRALAQELESRKHAPPRPRAELMPTGEIFNYLRERDARVKELEEQLAAAHRRIGQLEGVQETIKLLRDELAGLKGEDRGPQLPWWRRMFSKG